MTSACAEHARAEFLGSFEWEHPKDWFGGVSGIELSDDGTGLIVITDRARIARGVISRGQDGISGIRIVGNDHLRGHDGKLLIGDIVDSEGLAVGPDQSVYISFERVHRISHYADTSAASDSLKRPREFNSLPLNGGLEALAIDGLGRLFAMPEDAFDRETNIPVFRWDDGTWSKPFSLESDGAFLPVGADFGPDGRLYLLERDYSIFGFRSRVRSWAFVDDAPADERLEVLTSTGTHDNLEGLAVWCDAQGRIRLTMVSDDNFLPVQRTELVEYAIFN